MWSPKSLFRNPWACFSEDVDRFLEIRALDTGSDRTDVYVYVSLSDPNSETRGDTVRCISLCFPNMTVLGISTHHVTRTEQAQEKIIDHIETTRQLPTFKDAKVHVIFAGVTGLEAGHYTLVFEKLGYKTYDLGKTWPMYEFDALYLTRQVLREGYFRIQREFFTNDVGVLARLGDQMKTLGFPNPSGDLARLLLMGVYCTKKVSESLTN